jgi:hypothetical protein
MTSMVELMKPERQRAVQSPEVPRLRDIFNKQWLIWQAPQSAAELQAASPRWVSPLVQVSGHQYCGHTRITA